ncbi:phage terminase large subunit [Mesorhizobium sp. AR10]|uniref:phage terminase large subunit n=1 Tax=Mesorhizobium sp. AR10 TaxID=2865839 RepID=UPI00215E747A|nr:phage terminase large subunit [Mesorhizobium sp. AR10]UVK41216.1 phage terminase large subunit [Mesorhizobium sp. AR10]
MIFAIAESDEEIATADDRAFFRARGEALFPQREPLETLTAMRREMGEAAFSAQYQQNPVAPGGNRIRWEHWNSYDEPLDIEDYQFRVQSWDTGMSAEPTSDYSACTTWGYRDGKWWLLDVYRSRLDFGGLQKQVLSMMRRFRADKIIIESAATGKPLIRELIRERRLIQKVFPYFPRFDKEVRLNSQIAKLETGNFLLPNEAPWLGDFRKECLAFPNGKNDDMVDSLLNFWTGSGSEVGWA